MAIPAAARSVVDRLGRPLHDLRISLTDRCNLRCPYCMPADKYHENYRYLPREAKLSFEEIARVSRAFAALGVTKLRLTGGEPLLRKELPDLVRMLAGIPGIDDLALTTNGVLLPSSAAALKAAGLKRVTVSLDAMDEAVFRRMNGGRAACREVLSGIRAAEDAGLPVKVNAVVQRGVNDGEVLALAEAFRGTGHIVRFIEYMDVGTCNGWQLHEVVPSREILACIHARYPLRPIEPTYHGEVANRYAYVDGAGEVGFISSVTEPFCGACTRARLSADGKVFTCLFAPGGTDLHGALRSGISDEALLERIADIWRARVDRYSELRAERAGNGKQPRKVEMYQIGG